MYFALEEKKIYDIILIIEDLTKDAYICRL